MKISHRIYVVGIVGTLFWSTHGSGANAQGMAPPMDMSGAVAMQNYLGWRGYVDAQRAAQNYWNTARRLRAMGYTGPLWAPSQQDLQNSINGANAAMQNYNNAQYYNSQRRSAAVGDYTMRAVRGCWRGYDRYGRYGYICP